MVPVLAPGSHQADRLLRSSARQAVGGDPVGVADVELAVADDRWAADPGAHRGRPEGAARGRAATGRLEGADAPVRRTGEDHATGARRLSGDRRVRPGGAAPE